MVVKAVWLGIKNVSQSETPVESCHTAVQPISNSCYLPRPKSQGLAGWQSPVCRTEELTVFHVLICNVN